VGGEECQSWRSQGFFAVGIKRRVPEHPLNRSHDFRIRKSHRTQWQPRIHHVKNHAKGRAAKRVEARLVWQEADPGQREFACRRGASAGAERKVAPPALSALPTLVFTLPHCKAN